MNMQGIKSFTHGLKKWTMKNSPVILAGLGVAGLIGTAIAVAKGTVKASKIVAEKKPATKKEVVKSTWKCYIPATIIAAGSTACIIGGTVQGQKRLAALSALYSMSEQALKEYQDKAKEVVGEKNAEKISDKIAEDKVSNGKDKDFVQTEHGLTKVIESWTGRRFLSDIDFIKRTVNQLNSAIIHGETISFNEWLTELGLDTCMCGTDIGWDCEALIEISYRAKLDENDEPCIVLDYKEWPKYLYR